MRPAGRLKTTALKFIRGGWPSKVGDHKVALLKDGWIVFRPGLKPLTDLQSREKPGVSAGLENFLRHAAEVLGRQGLGIVTQIQQAVPAVLELHHFDPQEPPGSRPLQKVGDGFKDPVNVPSASRTVNPEPPLSGDPFALPETLSAACAGGENQSWPSSRL